MTRKTAWLGGALLTGSLVMTAFGGTAFAADAVEPGCVSAVSAVNGKVEGAGGYADSENEKGDFAWEAGGSLSLPLGCLLGFQADIGASNKLDETQYGAIGHLFIRDPQTYLFGVTGGGVDGDDTKLYAVGPEAEVYLGNLSLEAWGGYLNIDPDDGGGKDSGFIIGDVAYYLTDDLRLSVGGKVVDEQQGLRAGFEYQIGGMPMSVYSKADYGDDDFFSILGGLRFYFGGEDKSLIRRHREDDPRNRTFDLLTQGSRDRDQSGPANGGGGAPQQ
jgi:opacity protein-like surface antigen